MRDLRDAGHITVEQYAAIKAAAVNVGIQDATR
jgi:hypothetical protein